MPRFRCAAARALAEDAADVEDARRRGYEDRCSGCIGLRALEPRSILAHGVHLSEDEVRLAEQLRLWLVQNPRRIAATASAIHPLCGRRRTWRWAQTDIRRTCTPKRKRCGRRCTARRAQRRDGRLAFPAVTGWPARSWESTSRRWQQARRPMRSSSRRAACGTSWWPAVWLFVTESCSLQTLREFEKKPPAKRPGCGSACAPPRSGHGGGTRLP